MCKNYASWTNLNVQQRTSEYCKALCDLEGQKSASKMWKEMNPDDGIGFVTANPYVNTEKQEKLVEDCAKTLEVAKALDKFTREKICDNIKD